MANATTIVSSVVTNHTTTITFTSTRSTTIQLPPANLFGLPPEVFLIFGVIIVAIVFLFFRFQVKGVPTVLKWIYKTGSALQFRVQQDLNGLFINVLSARNKKLETLTQGAQPLEVTLLPDKVKFYINPEERGERLDEETMKMLAAKGFKIEETRRGKKNKLKGYLIYTEPKLQKVLAYLDVSLGGLKHVREYATIEGSGTTIDWQDRAKDVAPGGTGKAAIINEEISAGKSWLHVLAEAARGTLSSLLLPLAAGISIGGMLFFLISLLSGHFR